MTHIALYPKSCIAIWFTFSLFIKSYRVVCGVANSVLLSGVCAFVVWTNQFFVVPITYIFWSGFQAWIWYGSHTHDFASWMCDFELQVFFQVVYTLICFHLLQCRSTHIRTCSNINFSGKYTDHPGTLCDHNISSPKWRILSFSRNNDWMALQNSLCFT
jgi:hypothetical protein